MSADRDTTGGLITARAANPERVLLVADQDRLTYGEADRRSRLVAGGLMAAGVGRGDHVALLFGNSPDFVVAWLAVTRIGAVALPLSTMSTAHELGGLLVGSDTEYLITDHTYRGRDLAVLVSQVVGADADRPIMTPALPTLRHWWVGLEGLEARGRDKAALVTAAEGQVRPADVMVIVHTSGSTNAPKGVVHTHGGLIRYMRAMNPRRPLEASDRLFSNSPFFWIGGLAFSLIATMEAGGRLICSAAEPGAMLDLIEAERPNVNNGFAQAVAALARHPSFPDRDLSFMRRGNMYPILPPDVRPADPELRYAMLGMTEAGSVCLIGLHEDDLPEEKRGTFGRPGPGYETRVVDPETGQDAAFGEFWLRGPALMQGYYGRERWETFTPDGWYRTGDLVSVDADGDFFFKGRSGDMIKTAGANVSPREVEPVLSEAAGGRRAIVFGLDDAERGQIVVGVVVDGPAVDEAAIRAALSETLSRYKVPRRVVGLAEAELPLMSSGKLDMKRLAEIVRGR